MPLHESISEAVQPRDVLPKMRHRQCDLIVRIVVSPIICRARRLEMQIESSPCAFASIHTMQPTFSTHPAALSAIRTNFQP